MHVSHLMYHLYQLDDDCIQKCKAHLLTTAFAEVCSALRFDS